MTKIARSDDFVDGLQVAYKAVFRLRQQAVSPVEKQTLKGVLNAIDMEIDKACREDEVKIIV